MTPSFATLGQFDLTNVFTVLGPLAAVLTIFAIMLTDFFDTMGTVTGVASEAGLAERTARSRASGASCSSTASRRSPVAPPAVSSNTTYIESAAGVAEGGRTGLRLDRDRRSCSCSRSSCHRWRRSSRPRRPSPALVIVGYLMFTQLKDIDLSDVEDGFPALLTMILMPLTYDITVGIGAGFITWVVIKVAMGKIGEIHPLMWVVSIMFLVYFLQGWLNTLIATPAAS